MIKTTTAILPRPPKKTCPAELRAPSHRRAKRAAVLTDIPLVDFLSDAADCRSRRVLKKHGLPTDV